jgi:hypothetical protein
MLENGGVHRHGAAGALHQRVAVRRRIGRGRRRDRRAAAGPALDDERLAVLLLKNLRVSARMRRSFNPAFSIAMPNVE